MTRRVILCEGYQDRAFIGEWVDQLGWRADLNDRFARGAHTKVFGEHRLSIVPVDGKDNLLSRLTDLFAVKAGGEVSHWLVVTDSDELSLEDAADRWNKKLAATPGVRVAFWNPRLEGVVEAAVRIVFPARAAAIDSFLQSRADAPPATHKEAAQSFCAGWASEAFGEAFFAHVLRDPRLREEIKSLVEDFSRELTVVLSP